MKDICASCGMEYSRENFSRCPYCDTDDYRKTVRSVAAGLRAMNNDPVAFVYINGVEDDMTYDLPKILGIPVYHTEGVSCYSWGTTKQDCPFIPIWKSEVKAKSLDVTRFTVAYSEPQELA